ncbi:division/cell wall cluster transcriptional repressor MraZ [Halovulum dunhuangense]|uniref:Transcriptional regulator MraZ n=1 Tax=Halovulum dunhuangense TaxID=1505036 RepID=A0A849L163_9RHOB|nr:division/cell wall cluster transcriptional repressor MraZ [Halovulum dunhuangense]
MARRFRGESVHKVDGKGRVSIPAPFRRVLEEGDPDWQSGQNPNLVLIYGIPGKPCLWGFSIEGIERLDEEIEKLGRFSRERAFLERAINTQSTYAQVDENGRIVLSAKLRDMIGVEGEVTFAGMGDKFQVWEPSAYAADMEACMASVGPMGGPDDPFALLDRAGRGD